MPFPNPATQFKPGNSGLPGRPKKGIITDAAIEFLQSPHPRKPEKTRAQVVGEQWVKRAQKGEQLDLLLARVEGKVPDAPIEQADINPILDEMDAIEHAEFGSTPEGGVPPPPKQE